MLSIEQIQDLRDLLRDGVLRTERDDGETYFLGIHSTLGDMAASIQYENSIVDWIENQEISIRDGIEPEGTATRENAVRSLPGWYAVRTGIGGVE